MEIIFLCFILVLSFVLVKEKTVISLKWPLAYLILACAVSAQATEGPRDSYQNSDPGQRVPANETANTVIEDIPKPDSIVEQVRTSTSEPKVNAIDTDTPAASSMRAFTHPGILVTLKQLDFVKNHLDSEPWKSALDRVLKDPFARTDYVPTPWPKVECGSYSNPNLGCADETNDAGAAYTQAILWRLTGNMQYAENVRKILNAWANTLSGGHTESNAPLQAAWAAQLFTRAAEIVKYTYTGWPQPEKDRVTRMFATQYLPNIKSMFSGAYACYNKNWHASGIEAMANIGVFNKSTEIFDDAILKWKSLLPAYIYLGSDGSRPKNASWCFRSDAQISAHWYKPVAYVDGLSQETCRDFDHSAYGLAAIVNVAETARAQGLDLYHDKDTNASRRITSAMELHSRYQNDLRRTKSRLCSKDKDVQGGTKGTFEIGYNQYAVRDGAQLPETERFLLNTRPTKGQFHYLWETLTHGQIGL